jgi:hypothetical protein
MPRGIPRRPLPLIESFELRRLLAGDLAFAFSFGGPQNDRAADVAVDASGNIVVAGHFKQTVDFDPSSGVQSRTSKGDYDLYVAKHTPTGALLWVRTMGGTGWDESMAIELEPDGDVLLTGYFYGSADFDPGAGEARLSSAAGADGYVLKLGNDGSFRWVRQFAGSGDSGGTAITADGSGGIYVGGMYSGTVDVDPGSAVNNSTSKGALDAFVVKLTAAGSYVFGKKFGGSSGDEYVNGVAVGGDGHVQVAGSFHGSVDFDPSSTSEKKLTAAGGSDVFVQELSSTGSYVSARRVGGSGDDLAGDVAADSFGNVFVTGGFKGTVDFDPRDGTVSKTSGGDLDAFVLKLDSAAAFSWVYVAGGSSLDRGTDLALASDGGVALTGQFAGQANFRGGGILTSSGGTSDAFVARLAPNGAATWARRAGGSGADDVGEGIAVDGSLNVVTVGNFTRSGDFDPGAGTRTLTSKGEVDAFLLKLLA